MFPRGLDTSVLHQPTIHNKEFAFLLRPPSSNRTQSTCTLNQYGHPHTLCHLIKHMAVPQQPTTRLPHRHLGALTTTLSTPGNPSLGTIRQRHRRSTRPTRLPGIE